MQDYLLEVELMFTHSAPWEVFLNDIFKLKGNFNLYPSGTSN